MERLHGACSHDASRFAHSLWPSSVISIDRYLFLFRRLSPLFASLTASHSLPLAAVYDPQWAQPETTQTTALLLVAIPEICYWPASLASRDEATWQRT